jgi:hypothetical protein
MDSFTIKDLAKIIERDSKDATYKYALLRGTIEIIQEHDNYKTVSEDKVTFPLGLLIIKWIEYYYPIFCNPVFIPQKHGDSKERTIAFRSEFENVIRFYPTTQLSDQLFYDLKKGIRNAEKIKSLIELVNKTKNTIVKQPMHFIGSAINRGGQIYTYNKDSKRYRKIDKLNLEWIINSIGTFSIPTELYHVMKVVGSFVTGTHSIIFRWAEFTSNLSKEVKITTSDMITLLNSDFNERDIIQAKNFYSDIIKRRTLHCVWSGRIIIRDLHIDHMIPFIALRNNDLWNLLPSKNDINIRKSDKIPSKEILNDKNIKERIIFYWENILSGFPEQFRSEIQVSLLGKTIFREKSWKNDSYEQLVSICNHIIEDRGFDPWIKI